MNSSKRQSSRLQALLARHKLFALMQSLIPSTKNHRGQIASTLIDLRPRYPRGQKHDGYRQSMRQRLTRIIERDIVHHSTKNFNPEKHIISCLIS